MAILSTGEVSRMDIKYAKPTFPLEWVNSDSKQSVRTKESEDSFMHAMHLGGSINMVDFRPIKLLFCGSN